MNSKKNRSIQLKAWCAPCLNDAKSLIEVGNEAGMAFDCSLLRLHPSDFNVRFWNKFCVVLGKKVLIGAFLEFAPFSLYILNAPFLENDYRANDIAKYKKHTEELYVFIKNWHEKPSSKNRAIIENHMAEISDYDIFHQSQGDIRFFWYLSRIITYKKRFQTYARYCWLSNFVHLGGYYFIESTFKNHVVKNV